MGVRGVLRRILAIMRECNEWIECDPKIAVSWNFKGLALSCQGKYDEAIEAYNNAIELAPEWDMPKHNKRIALQELSWPERAQIKT
jgi:lipoprotein NlpI